MFPLYDDNPRLSVPVGTALLIALNIAAWVFVQGLGLDRPLAQSLCLYGLIPGDLLGLAQPGFRIPLSDTLVCIIDGERDWHNLFTSMFMHGGWFHIIGNMWFLWVFGDNVEDVMGTARYLAFYLLAGLAAALTQVATDPGSTVPMVGASGAIGGVMGAYARLYPRAQVKMLLFLGFFVTTFSVSALYVLGYWFLIQLLGGVPALDQAGGGVAFWAHIGGFVAGLLMSFVVVTPGRLEQHRRRQALARFGG